MKRYVLKSTAAPASREKPAYLHAVRKGGLVSVWGPREGAREFTPTTRTKFRRAYPHVAGRFVQSERAK